MGLPSASGLQRLVLCPGSWLAEKACPEQEPSEAAAMGTRLHKHMEEGTLPGDAVEAEACGWCAEMEGQLAEELLCPASAEVVTPSGYAEARGSEAPALGCFRERRLWDSCRRFSGQADVVYHNERAALVLDYKFGRVAVEGAEYNTQLYGLTLLLMDNFAAFDVVYCGILQPFVSRQRPVVLKFERKDVGALRKWLYGVLDAAGCPLPSEAVTSSDSSVAESLRSSETPELCPGEAQCKYCRAAASCPALGLQVQRAAGVQLTRWEQWSLEDRRKAWDAARLAKKYVEAIERKVRADLEAGVELPGLQLAAGKAAFTVVDAAGAFGELNALLGVSGEEFCRCCKVGITDLDKLVHQKLVEQAPEGVKQTTKASREWLRRALEGFGCVKVTAGSIKEC